MTHADVNMGNHDLLNSITQWTHAYIKEQFQPLAPTIDFMLLCGSILHPEYRRPDSDIDIIVSLTGAPALTVTKRRSSMTFASHHIPMDITYDQFEGISKAMEQAPSFLSHMFLEGHFMPGGDPQKIDQIMAAARSRMQKEKDLVKAWAERNDRTRSIEDLRTRLSECRASILWELDLSKTYCYFKLISFVNEYIEQVALLRGNAEQALLVRIYAGPRLFKQQISRQIPWVHNLIDEVNRLLASTLDARVVENVFMLLATHFQQEFGCALLAP